MRIAIYEPEPMVCGPMSWANHLQTGFRQLGHHCDVVTFTRSGKPRKAWITEDPKDLTGVRWRRTPPDVVAKLHDASTVLGGYDGVILNDPRTVWQDKQALEGTAYLVSDQPDYVTALAGTRVNPAVPFTFVLHGSTYHPGELPFIKQLLELDNFTGKAITHSPRSPERSRELWSQVKFNLVNLPYSPVHQVTDPGPATLKQQPIGITGRYTSIKGHHALAAAYAWGYLPTGVNVFLHGGCTTTRAPSLSLVTFENLLQSAPGVTGSRASGPVTQGLPWSMTNQSGDHLFYLSGYRDGVQVAEKLQVHLDLTSYKFTSGAVEYSQLEAIDAGSLQVSVDTMWDRRFVGSLLPGVETWPSDRLLTRDEDKRERFLKPIGDAVEDALSATLGERTGIMRSNREVLHWYYDPRRVAEAFLDALVR